MSDLAPRKGSRLSRGERETRGVRLVTIGGVAAVVAVIGVILAAFGAIGWGLPVIAAGVSAVCAVVFRRMMPR